MINFFITQKTVLTQTKIHKTGYRIFITIYFSEGFRLTSAIFGGCCPPAYASQSGHPGDPGPPDAGGGGFRAESAAVHVFVDLKVQNFTVAGLSHAQGQGEGNDGMGMESLWSAGWRPLESAD